MVNFTSQCFSLKMYATKYKYRIKKCDIIPKDVVNCYLCELISRRESSVNMRLGADHHQLIMPPISKDCLNTFLERSFIYAAPCEWNKVSECIRTSTLDSFRKSVKTMLFTQQYGC